MYVKRMCKIEMENKIAVTVVTVIFLIFFIPCKCEEKQMMIMFIFVGMVSHPNVHDKIKKKHTIHKIIMYEITKIRSE